ncbi:MAG: prolyl oligopeptidase family serine peptidase [Acidobacteriota bacterium]
MKKTLIGFLLLAVATIVQLNATAQEIPFLSELLSRYEEFNRLYTEKRRAGANLSSVEPLRKRADEAFRQGSIPGILEAIAEAQALLAGKKWDDRQRFIASLTLETDRLIIEPNQVLQVSLIRMFQVNIDKAFASAPTVTFAIISGEAASKPTDAESAPALAQPLVIAAGLTIAETSSNAARRLLLPDGVYQVVARIESRGQRVAEIKRQLYAISDFSGSIGQMLKTLAVIKSSSDAKVKAMAAMVATPEFQLQRLAPLNKTRGEEDLNPNQEMYQIEAELSEIAKGRNPFAMKRGEVERAYQAPDNKLVPYRVYVPNSYDGATPKPLLVMLHGALGDERSYFSGLFDPVVIKGEADRRGYILAGVNGRGRFASYSGVSQDDVFEVIAAVSRDYKIDASRIYLTGHSLGGFGTWLVASSNPERFAAIAAVSGGPPAQGDALTGLLEKLKGLPALVIHGAQDGIAPVQLSRGMAAAAQKAGLKVSYVEVPDGDHTGVVASTFPAVMDFFDKNVKSSGSK